MVAILALIITMAIPLLNGVGAAQPAPFAPPDPPAPPSTETPDVTEILKAIEGAKGVVPPLLIRQLREIARGRLADHHRLSVDRASDRPALDRLLSEPLRRITIADADRPENSDPGSVPLRHLPLLLDELDAL